MWKSGLEWKEEAVKVLHVFIDVTSLQHCNIPYGTLVILHKMQLDVEVSPPASVMNLNEDCVSYGIAYSA